MMIKYQNDLEDLVEIKISLGKISLKNWIFNNIFPVIYTIIVFILIVYVAITSGLFTVEVGALIFLFILTSGFLWVNTLMLKRNSLRRGLRGVVKRNPDYIQKKAILRKGKEFTVQNLENNKKTYKFKIDSIEKVVEKNDYLFFLKKGDKELVTIPVEAFASEKEKEEFLQGLNFIKR
ncbi:MAG: YcxB family protein [Clostridium sp.]|uniref:YcxB family protein n=1 Tax=Clostridium sp. TaxID=1506 RepID=UPI003EE5FFD9